jgi:hypothetical protein
MDQRFWSRRDILSRVGGGIGSLAAAELLRAEAPSALAPKAPHFAPKAKAVISIFNYGGVSHVDTFDPKPMLEKHAGEALSGPNIAPPSQGTPGGLMPSLWKFQRYGQSGLSVSELFPHVAQHADKLAVIRSMYARSNDHAPALYQMNTGFIQAGYPSTGSWVTYGLGSENQNLPAFVVFSDPRGGPIGGAPNWGNGFMPAAFQGTQFRSAGDPIVDLKPPKDVTPERQRRWLDLMQRMNETHISKNPGDYELAARIQSYELAFRMQTSALEAVDINSESDTTKKLYGIGDKATEYVGRQCLLARRLVERGVRYVQIFSGGGNFQESWDAHWDLKWNHETHCKETDQPIAALLTDLAGRGLLDSTLVVWHGEFGRLPISQRMDGRDHNPYGFTIWMAGGGTKGGTVHGATDEFGYAAIEQRTSTNDLHATMLHLLGLDHKRLTWPHNGRNMRLTDVEGELIKEVMA